VGCVIGPVAIWVQRAHECLRTCAAVLGAAVTSVTTGGGDALFVAFVT
jgi:C4-dicarboxylate transporter